MVTAVAFEELLCDPEEPEGLWELPEEEDDVLRLRYCELQYPSLPDEVFTLYQLALLLSVTVTDSPFFKMVTTV